MHSIPLIGLGLFFAIAGIALFAFTMRKQAAVAASRNRAPLKKSELREVEAQRTESTKLRVAGAISVAVGAALMFLS